MQKELFPWNLSCVTHSNLSFSHQNENQSLIPTDWLNLFFELIFGTSIISFQLFVSLPTAKLRSRSDDNFNISLLPVPEMEIKSSVRYKLGITDSFDY